MPKKAVVKKGKAEQRKSTRESSARLTSAQKKAVAILTEWAEQRVDIELIAAGVKFVGTILKLKISPNIDDFVFHSSFGVSASLFPMLYDDIRVENLSPLPPRLFLRIKRMKDHGFVLSLATTAKPSKSQVEEVHEQLRLWMKLNCQLCLTTGDRLRSRASLCAISEPNEGVFLFTNKLAATIDTLAPQQSEYIKITSSDGSTTIDLYNITANTFASVTDRADPPERIFERFAALTQTVH